MISNVAQNYNIHPQTLRLYERQGLLKPSRSEGNTRLYTDEDLERLELILTLTRDLGVNLAGVEVVLNMRDKMMDMQKEVGRFLEMIRREFSQVASHYQEKVENALVPAPPPKITRFKRPSSQ